MTSLKFGAVVLAAGLLAACSATLQTSSGADYLARYDQSHAAYQATSGVNADVRRIAAIEPTLSFPARIGVARIHNGVLTTLPADEARIWQDTASEIGSDYGDFVPISPLITSMVASPRASREDRTSTVINNIRRGAARQHVDYVLVYEVGSSTRTSSNALALADLTIVGMFVFPTRTHDIKASASAIMLDVRTGYPYATLTAHADKNGLSRAVSGWSTKLDYADTAEEEAVANLAGDMKLALEGLSQRAADMAKAPAAKAALTSDPSPVQQSPMARAIAAQTSE